MNYLAHGYRFVDDPWFLAGTATPDWLNVVDRKIRVREKLLSPWFDHADPQLNSFVKGVRQHHLDDSVFHRRPVFLTLNQQFLGSIREFLPNANSMAVWLLAHILIEILMDASLSESMPELLPAYYDSMNQVDAEKVAQTVSSITGKNASKLAWMIGRFCEIKFLYDYQHDDRLLFRLNQVMSRVKLDPIPDKLCQFFPYARTQVNNNLSELLADQIEGSHSTD